MIKTKELDKDARELASHAEKSMTSPHWLNTVHAHTRQRKEGGTELRNLEKNQTFKN